jgi:bacteriocin-like protein
MRKSDDTLRPATLEDHHTLTDSELNAVTGGYVYDSTYVMGIVAAQTNGAFQGRYQLRLDEANSLLSTQH